MCARRLRRARSGAGGGDAGRGGQGHALRPQRGEAVLSTGLQIYTPADQLLPPIEGEKDREGERERTERERDLEDVRDRLTSMSAYTATVRLSSLSRSKPLLHTHPLPQPLIPLLHSSRSLLVSQRRSRRAGSFRKDSAPPADMDNVAERRVVACQRWPVANLYMTAKTENQDREQEE